MQYLTHNQIGEAVADYYFSGFQGVQTLAQFVLDRWLPTLDWPAIEHQDPVTTTMVLQSLAEVCEGRAFELFDNTPMPKERLHV
jgi:hypothetical protein